MAYFNEEGNLGSAKLPSKFNGLAKFGLISIVK